MTHVSRLNSSYRVLVGLYETEVGYEENECEQRLTLRICRKHNKHGQNSTNMLQENATILSNTAA